MLANKLNGSIVMVVKGKRVLKILLSCKSVYLSSKSLIIKNESYFVDKDISLSQEYQLPSNIYLKFANISYL